MREFTTLVLLSLTLSVCLAVAETNETSGSLWIHNAKTPNGKQYLQGFVRGYVEGKRRGIDLIEGILPHADFEPGSRINKKQMESELFMETLYYARALEEENLKKAVDLVTEWYRDPQNRLIGWGKLVELAIGRVNGVHTNYTEHQLRWLQDVSNHKRVDWFHTIDPATGEGRVDYFDENGGIVRTELVW